MFIIIYYEDYGINDHSLQDDFQPRRPRNWSPKGVQPFFGPRLAKIAKLVGGWAYPPGWWLICA